MLDDVEAGKHTEQRTHKQKQLAVSKTRQGRGVADGGRRPVAGGLVAVRVVEVGTPALQLLL